ncbi:MAG: P-loop NTPase [Brevinematales bacterium]|nr:P-loop NTPase [Brevinematales bacterium]
MNDNKNGFTVAVASGKGGTGKTTISVNLAAVIKNVTLIDCDVEEPNCGLLLKPKQIETEQVTLKIPQIDRNLCDGCRKCSDVCEYNAIAVMGEKAFLIESLCHGCGACSYFCPQKAIEEIDKQVGFIESGKVGDIELITGKMDIGQTLSPHIIRHVRKKNPGRNITIIDAPPGTSCPVIHAVYGADFVLLVTEPTPFGLNDLKLSVGLLREMEIPFGVVINRDGLGDSGTEDYCIAEKIPLLMKIPFDRKIARIYSEGKLLINEFPEYRERFTELFNNVRNLA